MAAIGTNRPGKRISEAAGDAGGSGEERARKAARTVKPAVGAVAATALRLRTAVAPHPHGVRPLGNLLVDARPAAALMLGRTTGLGTLARLPDELLLDGVLARLDARTLARLAMASRACYAFAAHDELWRVLVIAEHGGAFTFRGTWRTTYAALAAAPTCTLAAAAAPPAVVATGIYSDVLYRPWQCAAVLASGAAAEAAEAHMGTGARGGAGIDRRAGLSAEAFIDEYERPNRPVVITDVVPQWPAFQRWRDRSYLLEAANGGGAGAMTWEIGPVHMQLADYFAYSDVTRDESPLYLFDPRFADKCPALATDYTVPEYFREDLFALLGPAGRPDYRWLIAGPARSGSTFHIDPNSTSAWNAVITGAKRWIMFPPGTVPPGVHPSADGAEVTSPVSLGEWFLSFYRDARAMDPPPVEFTAHAGDLVFVPHGWWHLVVNLTESIAITQNYVNRRNLLAVLAFLRSRPDQVSGLPQHYQGSHVKDLHTSFRAAFDAAFPGELEQLEAEAAARARAPVASFWGQVKSAPDSGPAFTFGFAAAATATTNDDEDDEDEHADVDGHT